MPVSSSFRWRCCCGGKRGGGLELQKVPSQGAGLIPPHSEQALPPPDVVPAVELEPDLAIDAERLETDQLVQRDASRIRQGDAGEGGMKTAPLQLRQQLEIERAADAGALRLRRDIDRGVDGMAIGCPLG